MTRGMRVREKTKGDGRDKEPLEDPFSHWVLFYVHFSVFFRGKGRGGGRTPSILLR